MTPPISMPNPVTTILPQRGVSLAGNNVYMARLTADNRP